TLPLTPPLLSFIRLTPPLSSTLFPYTTLFRSLRIGTMGLGPCIEKVIRGSGWKQRFKQLPYGKGIGLACSSYITGAGLPIYWNRSEEHTSELQSRENLVCRLLLEKKKKKKKKH